MRISRICPTNSTFSGVSGAPARNFVILPASARIATRGQIPRSLGTPPQPATKPTPSSAAAAIVKRFIETRRPFLPQALRSKPVMRAVAERPVLRLLALAEPDLFGLLLLEDDRPELGRLVRAVAERLLLRQAAGTPR